MSAALACRKSSLPKRLHRRVDQRLHRGVVALIELDADRLAARSGDPLRDGASRSPATRSPITTRQPSRASRSAVAAADAGACPR